MSEEELGKLSPLDRFLQREGEHLGHGGRAAQRPDLRSPRRRGSGRERGVLALGRAAAPALGLRRALSRVPGAHPRGAREPEQREHEHRVVPARTGATPIPRHVRIRSAELRNASAYWAQVQQAASPLAFMVVDAEVVDRNVIRLDTENVLDVELSPSAALVDPSKPVRVVWNGVARVMRLAGREAAADRGRLRSRGRAQERPPAGQHRRTSRSRPSRS